MTENVNEAPEPDSDDFLNNSNPVEKTSPPDISADAPATEPGLISTDPTSADDSSSSPDPASADDDSSA